MSRGSPVLKFAFVFLLCALGLTAQAEPDTESEELSLPDDYLDRSWPMEPLPERRYDIGEGDGIEDDYLDDDERLLIEQYNRLRGSDSLDLTPGSEPGTMDDEWAEEVPLELDGDPRQSDEQEFSEELDDPAEW